MSRPPRSEAERLLQYEIDLLTMERNQYRAIAVALAAVLMFGIFLTGFMGI